MPIEIIVPDAVTTPHPTWTETDGSTGNVNLALDDEFDSNKALCAGTNTGNHFIVSFGNLTSDIASINSIQFSTIGFVGILRGVAGVCSFDLLNASDSSYSLSEDKTFTDTTISTLQAGTERTTSDGSTAWTESDVNGIRMKVTFSSIANTSGTMNLNFLKIDVDYNEPLVDTYNTNDSKIHVGAGTLYVQSGTIYIN